ncbi:hypothetical protein SOVF_148760 [Spinacia oleracea]|nr:hypothetical protein SOVF_148760 [Spinacia oleracea]
MVYSNPPLKSKFSQYPLNCGRLQAFSLSPGKNEQKNLVKRKLLVSERRLVGLCSENTKLS